MFWQTRRRAVDLTDRGMIMGIVNVTPDSFSDGGQFSSSDAAVAHGMKLIGEGAEILDVGGESTRPGALPVSDQEEMRRILPVISALRQRTEALLSVDTMKPAVAASALEAGADIINDVSGFRDPDMRRLAAASGAGCVVMHMQGTPQTMQQSPTYEDVVREVRGFFAEALRSLVDEGVAAEQVVFDPGIGFGKTSSHNMTLLRSLAALSVSGRPLLLGVSRKSILSALTGNPAMDSRHWPAVALTSFAREQGVRILRVHAVLENFQALRMTEAILQAGAISAVPK